MAQKNRTEVKTEVTNEISATVTVAKHTGMLNDSLVESAVFRKDVVSTGTGSGAQALDYEDYDQIEFTATGNTTFSFSNLNDGDVVKLIVIKGSTDTVAFSGVTDIVESRTTPDTRLTYRVTKVNTRIYVERVDRQFSGTLGLSDFTGTNNATMVAVQHADWSINGNMLHFNAFFSINQTVSASAITFTVDFGSAISFLNSGQPALINATDAYATFADGTNPGELDFTITLDAAYTGIKAYFMTINAIIE